MVLYATATLDYVDERLDTCTGSFHKAVQPFPECLLSVLTVTIAN